MRAPINLVRDARSVCLACIYIFLAGCVYQTGVPESIELSEPVLSGSSTAALVDEGRISAVGYAVIDVQKGQTQPQRRLMAIRASKLDAYRNMAEQVYGVFLESTSEVSELAIKNENIRGRVQGIIYGSQLESITPIGRDSYQTTLSLRTSIVEQLASEYRASSLRMGNSAAGRRNISVELTDSSAGTKNSRPRWNFKKKRWEKEDQEGR